MERAPIVKTLNGSGGASADPAQNKDANSNLGPRNAQPAGILKPQNRPGLSLVSALGTEHTTTVPGNSQGTVPLADGADAEDAFPTAVDVVIIGAGPAGLTLALDLARREVPFLIVDINASPVVYSRAMLVHCATLEVLADLGVAERMVLAGNVIRGAQLVVNNKQAGELKFSVAGTQSKFPFALALEQSEIERLLIERLREFGHRVHRLIAAWKVEVPVESNEDTSIYEPTNLKADVSLIIAAQSALRNTRPAGGKPGGGSLSSRAFSGLTDSYPCTVHLKPFGGEDRPAEDFSVEVKCKFVIGCDGARSSVRRAIDIPFPARNPAIEYLVADVSVLWGVNMASDKCQIVQNAGGALLCFPLTRNRWRFICTRQCPIEEEPGSTVEPYYKLPPPETSELQQILQALVPGTVLQEQHWTTAFAVSPRMADTLRKERAILVGDAGHVQSPLLAQGMNSGIQDAANLGWKLAAVCNGSSLALLDTYADERRSAAEHVAKNSEKLVEPLGRGGAFMRCVMSGLGPVMLNLEITSSWVNRVFSMSDLKYAKSAAVGDNHLGSNEGAAPGRRVPDSSVVALQGTGDVLSLAEVPCDVSTYLNGGHHTLIFAIHVLPPGTRAKTIFGCERKEEAVRWNQACLEKLARIGRLLVQSFKPKSSSSTSGTFDNAVAIDGGQRPAPADVRIVWILCGLVNFKNPKNTVGLGQIKDHVPHRLKHFCLYGSKIPGDVTMAVDYENSVHRHFGFRLADPDGFQGPTKSGAFLLIRPDGYAAFNGYAGDTIAAAEVVDYGLQWFGS